MKTISKTGGYSLIELIAALVVISLGLGSLYAVMHRGLDHMKIASSKNYAVVAAASELEIIKAMSKNGLPDNYAGPFKGDIDLSPLQDGKAILKIEDYKGSGGSVKLVTATVNWSVAGRNKRVSLSTLVSEP